MFLSLLALLGVALSAAPSEWVPLNDGHKMTSINLGTCCGSDPRVGMGPWIAQGGIGVDGSIDYGNQDVIGEEIAKAKVKREQVYITSKITAGCGQPSDCAIDPQVALDSIHASLKQFNTTYIDLILLHRPCQESGQRCSIDPKLTNCTGPSPIKEPAKANNALWQGLMEAKRQGLVRSIGVSNYNVGQLQALTGDVPAVNQCEMSIEGYDNYTLNYCISKGIVYEAYGGLRGCPWSNPTINQYATALKVSVAQICLRWILQRGAVLAAGTGSDASTVAEYTKENLDLLSFNLTDSQMHALNNMQI